MPGGSRFEPGMHPHHRPQSQILVREIDLTTNAAHPIVRIGDRVHRPAGFWSEANQQLLTHLAKLGFNAAPRPYGFDEVGREVVGFVEGDSGAVGWYRIHSEQGLRKYAALLRDYHRAVKNFKPTGGVEFSNGSTRVMGGQVVCHGDFGPWNLVWDEEGPIGILDWDLAHPADPLFDVLYAVEYSAPYRDDQAALDFHHFDEAPDRRRRIEVFFDEYGIAVPENIHVLVAAMQRGVGDQVRYLASRGSKFQQALVNDGDLEIIENRAQWSEAQTF